ncbi:hypothetical protein [Rhizobium sp. PDO1-076]|uniref:hypothetical protein n=1 Tax=Rhizobium sp. PDO1-076 TaxID=1125979 RepID=UPI0002E12AE3|nr:hypothetical protein [Rhizobium sp. PDO1-076]
MAIDLLRVLHLAMRAGDYHQEGDVTSMADVTSSTLQILLNARETLNDAEARHDR